MGIFKQLMEVYFLLRVTPKEGVRGSMPQNPTCSAQGTVWMHPHSNQRTAYSYSYVLRCPANLGHHPYANSSLHGLQYSTVHKFISIKSSV
ncbi:hypothetical protein HI914_03691 [Erysiphe necator]|nr:hypothetical protein HI914_03691 [Erysiphe necator]